MQRTSHAIQELISDATAMLRQKQAIVNEKVREHRLTRLEKVHMLQPARRLFKDSLPHIAEMLDVMAETVAKNDCDFVAKCKSILTRQRNYRHLLMVMEEGYKSSISWRLWDEVILMIILELEPKFKKAEEFLKHVLNCENEKIDAS